MTDKEIIDASLRHYIGFLSDALTAMTQKTFRLPSGKELTKEEIAECFDTVKRASALLFARRDEQPAMPPYAFLVTEQESLNELSPLEVLHGSPSRLRETIEPCQVRMLNYPEADRYRKVEALLKMAAKEAADSPRVELSDEQIGAMWQDLNNAFARREADRDTPLIVQFARALLASTAL